jgi:hypothetical protein
MRPVEILIGELLAHPDVAEAAGDMMGERSFQVVGREFMHLHGSSTLHVHLSREEKEAAIAAGEARQHPYAPRSGMVELRLTSDEQLPDARRLVGLALTRVGNLAERWPATA